MGYNFEEWLKRFENRSDITTTLTHLTRDRVYEDGNILSSVEVLLKILKERRIIGSTGKGFIHGQYSAVCFQDAPAYGVGQNILHEETYRKELGGKIRYSANGLIFLKRYVYKKGGRPVFYEKLETAKHILPLEEWWRIVSHDLDDRENIIDWTHEREWRVKGDFEFELPQAYVLLRNSKEYKEFVDKADEEIIKNIAGITAITPIMR